MVSIVQFKISTGEVWIDDVLQPTRAYSGHGPGLDNPAAENVKAVGPIPEGVWQITSWFDHPKLGPLVSHLLPVDVPNQYGRSAFFIHGDNSAMNHTASDGCIVMDHELRSAVFKSNAKLIKVIS